jgi:hypothetical protein
MWNFASAPVALPAGGMETTMKRILVLLGVLFAGLLFADSAQAQNYVRDGFGKCMHVPQESRANGVQLRTWDCIDKPHLKWKKTHELVVGEYFWLENNLTGKCAAVHTGKHQDGSPVVQWDCRGEENFQWSMHGDQIKHRESGKCLHSASGSNYAPLTIRTCAVIAPPQGGQWSIAAFTAGQPCGKENERPCLVTERIPSCDTGLIEWGTCVKKGVCGKTFQRPCTLADRIPPSCDAGLSEDFSKKECVPTRAGHAAFFDGLKSLTDEVAKGSTACEAFFMQSTKAQKPGWFAEAGQVVLGAGATALTCGRYLAIGFICAAPSQAKKVGAPVEIYNNIADAYESQTCAPEVEAPRWRYRRAKLLGPSRGLDCPYDSNQAVDPRGNVSLLFPGEQFDPPFYDPIGDPTGKSMVGSCWACPKFTFRSASRIQSEDACMRGDARHPQLRAMCAGFTTFSDRGVKPLQCMERLIRAVLFEEGQSESDPKVCTMAGALAFDQAVDVAIGKVDPKSSAKKLADAIIQVRKTLKGPAIVTKINEEVRKIDACKGLFEQ